MANFCLGDGRRLGKALPQHKLMQNLLLSDFGRPRIEKITKGTQTESRKVFSETNCCCGQLRKHDSETFVKKQAKKLEDKVNGRRMNQDYQKLMASIRERVAVGKGDDSFCSCSGKCFRSKVVEKCCDALVKSLTVSIFTWTRSLQKSIN
jgi:hypothetical protein